MKLDILSTSNPRVKSWSALSTRKGRDRTGLFLVEGFREIQRMAATGVVLDTVILCPDITGNDAEPPAADRLNTVSKDVFARLSHRQNPDGWLAVAVQPSLSLDRCTVSDQPFVVVVEGLEKPGNLGAILRSADGAGVDLVILADTIVDVFNPNVIRAAQGSLFATQIAATSTEHTLQWLTKHSIDLLVATPDAEYPLWDANIGDRIALLVGSEHWGVSPMFRASARAVTIPMAGTADSLNAATAAALLMYEVVRRRR